MQIKSMASSLTNKGNRITHSV